MIVTSRVQSPLARPWILFLMACVLGACTESQPVEGPLEPAPKPVYAEDVQAKAFIGAMRQAVSSGKRPPAAELQRLKDLGMKYPDEATVEQTVLSVLPALREWDGLAAYLEGKSELTTEQKMTLTRVYLNQADYQKALELCGPVADADPTHVEANSLAGRASYFLGQNERAASYYDGVWDSIVDQRMLAELANRAMLHFDSGELDRAIEVVESAQRDNPESAHLHNTISRLLAAKGDLEGAERHSQLFTAMQDKVSEDEQHGMRQASQTLALNEAWGRKDLEGCERLIHKFLPGATESFRNELYRFLGSMYQAAGRQTDAPAAIERARQHALASKDS